MSRIWLPGVFLLLLLLGAHSAIAAVEPNGLLDQVADRFLEASSTWASIITHYASWLFWTLMLISMVWTFGMMALRKADIGEFFAEFVRFTIFTGFFWWLLVNGPKFALDIINSFRTIAAQASNLPRGLTPSTPISIGFDIVIKAMDNYSILSPIDNLSITLISIAILACMAIVAANLLMTLVSAWVLAYAGIFILGFGGSHWTSDIAINYFRNVLGIALKLMTMTLLVGIAVNLMDNYYASLSDGAPIRELLLVFVVALVLVILISQVPLIIAGLIPGGSGSTGIGNFSAGAIAGTAMGAASVGAMASAALAKGTTNMAGGAQAVMAAFSKASAATSENGGSSMGNLMKATSGGSGSSNGSAFSSLSNEKSSGIMAKTAKVAMGTISNLAKGAFEVGKTAAIDRISETTGGKIAQAIKEQSTSSNVTFTGNHLAAGKNQGSSGATEVEEFVNREK